MAQTLPVISLASLRDELRVQISDKEAKSPAFRIRVTDTEVTSALLTITGTQFQTNLTGGSTADLDIDLVPAGQAIDILTLVNAIETVPGYEVRLDPEGMWTHEADDLRQTPATGIEIGQQDYLVQHHAFSDTELNAIINRAAQSHSPVYTSSTVPDREAYLVMMLSHITICRLLMHDNARFYAIEGDLTTTDKGVRVRHYRDLITSLRDEYDKLVARLGFKPEDDVDGDDETGVVVVGQLRRRSHRLAARVPFQNNTIPHPISGLAVSKTNGAVTDPTTQLWLEWDRIREANFSHVTILRQEGGNDKLLDNMRVAIDTFSGETDFEVVTTVYDPARTWYLDENLTTATTYHYRIYIVDQNGESKGSTNTPSLGTD